MNSCLQQLQLQAVVTCLQASRRQVRTWSRQGAVDHCTDSQAHVTVDQAAQSPENPYSWHCGKSAIG
ncbi:hypothetical protein L798_02934 [Zootermopsis nevadensis]|uniref:Uncharacterized protein n=1 Tax=Zootermopsis nevadensis TaxID=136037 RepID=A0A067QJ77_ZOONE|nr:hypothetical protein L798_02934 [Zootermopsis nevadensis]